MEIELQSSFLRAARAWLGEDQAVIARAAGVSERTLIEAEKARSCSGKTWTALTAYYASRGIVLREGTPLLIQVSG